MRCKVLVLACSLFCSTTALAGDGDDMRPFDWTGFYAGLHGGYAMNGADLGMSAISVQDLDGGVWGGQVGYQHHLPGRTGLMLGIEADASFGNLRTVISGGGATIGTGEIDAQGTVRARLGLAAGRLMPYVTAGLLWTRIGAEIGPARNEETKLNAGWIVGGGFEHAISERWSLKFEGLYGELASTKFALGRDSEGNPIPDAKINHDVTLLRFGVNARF